MKERKFPAIAVVHVQVYCMGLWSAVKACSEPYMVNCRLGTQQGKAEHRSGQPGVSQWTACIGLADMCISRKRFKQKVETL